MWYDYRNEIRAEALARAEAARDAHAPVLMAAEQACTDAQREAAILNASVELIRAQIKFDEEVAAAVAARRAERESTEAVSH